MTTNSSNSLFHNPSIEIQLNNQEKKTATLRQYTTDYDRNDHVQQRVHAHYAAQHTFQTVEFVTQMVRCLRGFLRRRFQHKKWLNFDHGRKGVMECLRILSDWIDESDPDVDIPNIVHAYQTAERIRKAHPDKCWFQVIGLVHDLGKVMSMWGEEQWATTGDTYPVGCQFADSIVYRSSTFDQNPDLNNSKYNSKLGIYEAGCGLKNLLMIWGHDEYMYQVLKNDQNCTLPEEGLHVIRFHSFYPYHTGGDYKYFEDENDKKYYPLLMELNKYDLYSKNDEIPDIEKLEEYYQEIVDDFIPGLVKW